MGTARGTTEARGPTGRGTRRAVAAVVPAVLAVLCALPEARAADACAPVERLAATGVDVAPAFTLRLPDGRTGRLAGIVAAGDPARAEARFASLVATAGAEIGVLAGGADRHGRVAVAVTTEGADAAATLASEGLAFAAPGLAAEACLTPILAAEAAARAAGRVAAPRRADDPTLEAEAGRFVVVAGRVRSVGRSGGRTYLNFGTDFARDFTVVIGDKDRAAFRAAGRPLDRLSGREVIVRGVVEARGGPYMEVTVPTSLDESRATP